MTTQRKIDFRYAPTVRWTCIGRPDDPHKTLVSAEGSLLYDFELDAFHSTTFRFKRTVAFRLQTDRQPLEIGQQTESAHVPVVKTTLRYPKATLELTAFGHQHHGDRRTDVVLWTIQAAPQTDEFLTGLWLQIQALSRRFVPATLAPSQRIYAVEAANIPQASTPGDLFRLPEAAENVAPPGPLAFVSVPQPLRVASPFDFGPSSGLMTEPALVGPDKPLQGALIFPLNHNQTAGLDFEWAGQALNAERRFWSGYTLQPLVMELPDPDAQAMVTACARNIMQAREIKAGLPEFQVGPTVYRGLWVVDGHFFLEAAQYLGRTDDAGRGLKALLRRVDQETGAIEEMKFHTKETGIALTTLVRQAELAGDLERLNSLWPIIRRAVDYIQTLREASKARGPDAPEYGLMAPSFGDGGLGGMRAEYTTPLWTLIGLKEVARIAPQLGHVDDAARFQAAFDDLMRAFRVHAERDRHTLADGTPYLPMLKPGSDQHHWLPDYPGTPEPWHRANPGTATWALAQAIYPGQLFAPDDPLVQNFCQLLDLIDDEEGIPAETGWLPYRAVWGYAASFYAHVWLYAGRPDKAIDYLYAFANHATPTRVWREEQSFAQTQHGQFVGDMPHNWASVEFIRLVRHLLVFERGDVLELLPALPPEWLVADRSLHLEDSPTRFGPVSLSLRLDVGGEGQIEIGLNPDWPLRPDRCVLHIPQAAKTKISQVLVNHQPVVVAGDGTVELPITNHIMVRGMFR